MKPLYPVTPEQDAEIAVDVLRDRGDRAMSGVLLEMMRLRVRLFESFYEDPDGPPMYDAEFLRGAHSQPDRGEVE